LNTIRQAEAGKGKVSLELAFRLFERSLIGMASYRLLAYTSAADACFKQWRNTIRIGSQDLRIASIAIVHGAKLVTRNARDFTHVPGLNLEVWN
jgi:tRNA(fMet)-specific endonuclease VapC